MTNDQPKLVGLARDLRGCPPERGRAGLLMQTIRSAGIAGSRLGGADWLAVLSLARPVPGLARADDAPTRLESAPGSGRCAGVRVKTRTFRWLIP